MDVSRPGVAPAGQRRGINLEDVTDLRTKLDEVLSPIGLPTAYPSNSPLMRWDAVSAAHFKQIREKQVKGARRRRA